MTIITKVGASYIDQMNDDTPEVDSFSGRCYQALSSPLFLRREPGNEATPPPNITNRSVTPQCCISAGKMNYPLFYINIYVGYPGIYA